MNRWFADGVKRAFDVLFSLMVIILLSPLYLILIIRIWRDSPGPVFYRGPRVGRDGKPFKILKFRTMYECPDSYKGPRITAQDDPRITSLGRWLRDSKLNELPQFWNVVKGDMSLVGPRPEDPEIVAQWSDEVRSEILSVRPGVTSPASVIYRNEERLLNGSQIMDQYLEDILPSKLRLDQLYVRHRSFWGDLDVLFWTALVLVPRIGPRQTPEARKIFIGPFSLLMRRHIYWLIGDTFVTFIAMGLAGLFFRTLGPLNLGWSVLVPVAIGFAVLFSLSNAALGVNRIDWSQAAANDAFDLLPGAGIATFVAMLFNYLYPSSLVTFLSAKVNPSWYTRPLLPTGLVIVASIVAFFGFVVVRYRTRLITGLATRWVNWRGVGSATQERVLIVGGGETGRLAAWMLNQGRFAAAYRVIGFVDDDLYKQDIRIHGVNVLGQRLQIPDLVKDYDVGMIIFAIYNISADERQQVLDFCWSTPAKVMLFPDIPASLVHMERGTNPFTLSEDQPVGDGRHGIPSFRPPYHLSRLLPSDVDSQLAQLEEAIQAGDLETAQARLDKLRAQLRDGITEPAASDQPGKGT